MKILTSDSMEFEISKEMIDNIILFKNMFEDLEESDEIIPISNVDSETFGTIVNYFRDNVFVKDPIPPKGWDSFNQSEQDFINGIEEKNSTEAKLFKLIEAANFLNIDRLLNLTACKIAELLKGKSIEEIRNFLGIEEEENSEPIKPDDNTNAGRTIETTHA